jgi:hypothetical protein
MKHLIIAFSQASYNFVSFGRAVNEIQYNQQWKWRLSLRSLFLENYTDSVMFSLPSKTL